MGNKECQALICKCGNIYAASLAPHCFTSKDFQKDVADAYKAGHTIKMIPADNIAFRKCQCPKPTPPAEIEFPIETK